MVVRWTFEDPTTLEVYTFEVNPREDNTPGWEKNFGYQNTSAPDGKVLVFEGRDNVRRGSFSGTLFTQEHFDTLQEWWAKRRQITVTDDLGRSYSVVLETFKPTRKRSYHHPWRHDYEITYVIVDWP